MWTCRRTSNLWCWSSSVMEHFKESETVEDGFVSSVWSLTVITGVFLDQEKIYPQVALAAEHRKPWIQLYRLPDRIYFYFSPVTPNQVGIFKSTSRQLSAQLDWKYMEVHCATSLHWETYLFVSFVANCYKQFHEYFRIIFYNNLDKFAVLIHELVPMSTCCIKTNASNVYEKQIWPFQYS